MVLLTIFLVKKTGTDEPGLHINSVIVPLLNFRNSLRLFLK